MNKLCAYLECSKSGYYSWITLGRPKHKAIDEKKAELILEIYQSNKTKGRRRIMMELKRKFNIHMCLGSVHYYMKLLNIKSIVKRKSRKKSDDDIEKEKSLYQYENILNRDFHASQPNQKWVTDITHLHSKDGKEYLSVIKDLYDKSIISYYISNKNDNDLVLNTLNKAFDNVRYKNLEGLIIHSDQGSQYTSKMYCEILNDNASIESFFSTYKSEIIKPNKGRTKSITRRLTIDWIKEYNLERPQINLKELTPIEFRSQSLVSF